VVVAFVVGFRTVSESYCCWNAPHPSIQFSHRNGVSRTTTPAACSRASESVWIARTRPTGLFVISHDMATARFGSTRLSFASNER
jgi:hypothetical protein